MEYATSIENIQNGYESIKGHITKTPLLTCSSINEMAGKEFFFKCENFQKTGSFKFRGACNAVFNLSRAAAAKGVITHSSGNFAQALARAARTRRIPANIVMPRTAPQVKVEAVKSYGGQVTFCDPTLQAREETAAKIMEETGATLLHPYNNTHVIAGHGSLVMELLEDAPDIEAIFSPVGGGGLISGITLSARALLPGVSVYGAEPAGADDAARSKVARKLIPQTGPATIADGLLSSLGNLTWPVIRDLVAEVVTVTEEEILQAVRLLFERMKIVVEPSGGVSLAGALKAASRLDQKRIAIVLSGGNVDLKKLARFW